MPTEFGTAGQLTGSAGMVKPEESALVKGMGAEFALRSSGKQDVLSRTITEMGLGDQTVAVVALVFAIFGLILGAAALCVTCRAAGKEGAPVFAPAIAMTSASTSRQASPV